MTWVSVASRGLPSPAPVLPIQGEWYVDPPNEARDFIEETSIQIARDFNCSNIAVRSAIHNTRTNKNRGPGQRPFIKAPWHFTVEFQHRVHGNWMAAHVYTNTLKATVGGYTYNRTDGLQTLDRLRKEGIKQNPERFLYVNPTHRRMKPKRRPFGLDIPAKGYRPQEDW